MVTETEPGTFSIEELVQQHQDALLTVGALAWTSKEVCMEERLHEEAKASLHVLHWIVAMLEDLCDLSRDDLIMQVQAKLESLGVSGPMPLDA